MHSYKDVPNFFAKQWIDMDSRILRVHYDSNSEAGDKSIVCVQFIEQSSWNYQINDCTSLLRLLDAKYNLRIMAELADIINTSKSTTL